jgi:hypothetical protein
LIPSLTPCSPNPRSRVRLEYKRSKGGFPIRKSLDHSSFAAPQGLSQRTTSFIASQRQGIHRMLLRHLIALMIDARRLRNRPEQKDQPPALSDQRLMLAKHIPHRALAPAQDMFPLHDVKHVGRCHPTRSLTDRRHRVFDRAERETKAAASRHARPDWPHVFQEIREGAGMAL